MTERAKELLQAVEILTSRMGEAPKNFSGGMQQRVQISKALANNPSLLLLDEVTTGLDLSVQAKVLDLIRQIKRDTASRSCWYPTTWRSSGCWRTEPWLCWTARSLKAV